jgi:DNA polymerase III epsilon subunit-like protein
VAPEIFVSVDIETSGPIPGEYSLLSIGACDVYDAKRTFACELRPISDRADPKALQVSGLGLHVLRARGLAPVDDMSQFRAWLRELGGGSAKLIFVGFNAPFDWSFINYYFHKYLGENPFGFSALDIKAYYMGAVNCAWADTRSSVMDAALRPGSKPDHKALHDAQYQAELFRLIRQRRSSPSG